MRPVSARFALLLLTLCAPVPAGAQSPAAEPRAAPTLHEQLDTWFAQAAVRAPGEWGVAVADYQGRLLWGVEPTRPLIPASAVKLLTTGYARSVLGSDARKTTRVLGRGRIDPATGTWEGTWALEVNGDPTLERAESTATHLADLARQLAAQGVRRLAGPLAVASAVGDPDARFPATWEGRHRGRLFAPLVGNLTVNGNVLTIRVAPGRAVGARVAISGAVPEGAEALVTVQAQTVSGRRNRLRLDPQGQGRFVLAGTLGRSAGERYVSKVSDDPRAMLEAAWGAALSRAGIEWTPSAGVSASEGGERLVLAEVRSPPFDSIASEVNRRSSNVGAELLLRWAAAGDPTPADRLTAHVQQITGDYGGVRLVDGSGLSSGNQVAPLTFTNYLARFPLAPGGRNFPMLLPANGTGTLSEMRAGLPGAGVVRAKTGTLGNVSSLVGYLGQRDGVLLVALMYNGSSVSRARESQWDLFRQLGAHGVLIMEDSLDRGSQGGGLPPD